MDLLEARSLFPVTRRYCYFDHAAVAPIPSTACESIKAFTESSAECGFMEHRDWFPRLRDCKAEFAKLIGVATRNVAMIKNTTSGIIIASNAISARPGDNVIIADCEFPANVYPWVYRKGLEVRMVKSRAGVIEPDDVEALMDNRTRAVSVSMVTYSNGCRNNVEAIGGLCAKRGAFFVVDGIQAIGALKTSPLDFGADFFCADGHKWLLGPEGAGFMYVSDRVLEECEPANIGWFSVENPFDFENLSQGLKTDAGRFEEGTPNMAGYIGLLESLKIINAVSIEKVEETILKMTVHLRDTLKAAGAVILSPDAPHRRSGITTFSFDGVRLEPLCKSLLDKRFVISRRGGGIRVSPHLYNNMEEINTFIREVVESVGRRN